MITLKQKDFRNIQYVLAATFNSFKEFRLRMKNTKFKLWLLFGLISYFITPWLSLVAFGIMICVFLLDFFIEIRSYIQISNRQKKYYPNGIVVEFNEDWFQLSAAPLNNKWNKIHWNEISIVFDNKSIKNISLYNENTKDYHLFFWNNKNEKDSFMKFRELAISKVRRIY